MGKYLRAADRLSDHLWLLRGEFDRPARHRLVRSMAAEMLGCPPHEVALTTDTNGKPHLSAPGNASLCVSLSHRDDMVLLGTADTAIGVDIERIEGDYQAVAQDHFSPGECRWLASVHQPDAFTRLWTAKEAVLKATGQGIALGMAEPDLSPLLRPGKPFETTACDMGFAGQTFSLQWWPLAGDRPALAASAILRHPLVTFFGHPFPAPAPHAFAAQCGVME